MKSVTQKIVAAAMAASISLISPCTYAAAAPVDNGVAPCYEIATSASSTLSISGTTATCISRCNGVSTVSITAVQTLQKQGLLWIWSAVDGAEWTETVSLGSIGMSNTKTNLSSGTYRLKSVFTLTNSSGETETITVYSTEEEL